MHYNAALADAASRYPPTFDQDFYPIRKRLVELSRDAYYFDDHLDPILNLVTA